VRFLPNLVATALVLVCGAGVLWVQTDGARAFTSESARRLAVKQTPRPLPQTLLEASDRRLFALEKFRGRIVVVDFIYTHCPTVCVRLGTTLARLQSELNELRRDDVHLLSIGFDLARDTPDALSAYGQRHGSNPKRWTLSRVTNANDLRPLLSAFGIVVIPDEFGGFTHNAALHIVDHQGRLVRIFDDDDIDGVREFIGTTRGS
jgi:protein SCO1/2